MHTNVINLDTLSWLFEGKIELRFEMRDRNGIDFVDMAHYYRLASVEGVPLIEISYGYGNISARDGSVEYQNSRVSSHSYISFSFSVPSNSACFYLSL